MPEPRQLFTDRKAAQAARADLIRAGYACQLLPAWALVAVGPVPGARPPRTGEPTAQPAADDGPPRPHLSASSRPAVAPSCHPGREAGPHPRGRPPAVGGLSHAAGMGRLIDGTAGRSRC
jgi:hypothetical protein